MRGQAEAISAAAPSGPLKRGSASSVCAAKTSPRTLTRCVSSQRASASCASTAISIVAGKTRRTELSRTQGRRLAASRTSASGTSRQTRPRIPEASRSSSTGPTRAVSPVKRTAAIGRLASAS